MANLFKKKKKISFASAPQKFNRKYVISCNLYCVKQKRIWDYIWLLYFRLRTKHRNKRAHIFPDTAHITAQEMKVPVKHFLVNENKSAGD